MNNDRQIHELSPYKRSLLVQTLDRLCDELELSTCRYQQAQERYEAVGDWLAGSDDSFLSSALIYPQGSIALGTTVKPLNQAEFDVDLVCFLPTIAEKSSPAAVKALVGNRLKEHGKYDGMLEEKQRCWRINYANEFHLDITPAITNEMCAHGGELVPDRKLAIWKATNPRGYCANFERRAAMRPLMYAFDRAIAKADSVQDFPEQQMSKPPLKRIVQLLKRHRDKAFSAPAARELAPISVIITTLAAYSYERCITQSVYADMYELIVDVITRMPDFIQRIDRGGRIEYRIDNDATLGENFAEKWNHDPRLATAFFSWHAKALEDLSELIKLEGQDVIAERLTKAYGATRDQAIAALGGHVRSMNFARASGYLLFAPSVGLTTQAIGKTTPVRSNTFFGD
ncbi:nucleotidyltransferase domain-containing protein [Burkholderia gladioli]|uniref:nucleotidyltransferase domain-containing protein n=1 Tax=Burkholderia gladioli TaxID=28095 RepID=UPI0003A765B8|nr:nucleotidyltransferase [Burkholderia gladioli]